MKVIAKFKAFRDMAIGHFWMLRIEGHEVSMTFDEHNQSVLPWAKFPEICPSPKNGQMDRQPKNIIPPATRRHWIVSLNSERQKIVNINLKNNNNLLCNTAQQRHIFHSYIFNLDTIYPHITKYWYLLLSQLNARCPVTAGFKVNFSAPHFFH